MTYNSEIKEIELKPFAELYYISSGTREWFYTSFSQDVVFGGDTYLATMIKSQIPSDDDNFKPNRIQVQIPVVSPFGEYIANTPVEPVTIQITRVFLHDLLAFKILFTGQVLGVTFIDNGDLGIASADVESNSIYFRNKIPRVSFKSYCNNTLFYPSSADDPDCNVNRLSYELNAVITKSLSTLISATFATKPDGYFIGGHIKTDYGDLRMVTDHIGSVVTLNVPFDARLSDGASIKAYPGCDKAPQTCIDKFNNFANFKGFPFVPSNNPTLFGADR